MIQTAKDVQIVRLTRQDRTFRAHLVDAAELADALTRPTLRAEAVLDGIFAQAVVVVEADGDRLVYQTAWETVRDDFRIDLHFSTVGGTGGIADTCKLYRTLKIPIAVVADLDMLVDREKISAVLKSLVPDSDVRGRILQSCAEVSDAVRRMPPTITAGEVAAEVASIGAAGMDWNKAEDLFIRRRLRALANKIDRMSRLKSGGISAYSGELRAKMDQLLAELSTWGLYLVPVGELEGWLREFDVPCSKSRKRAWANAAAQRIQDLGRHEGHIWEFLTAIGGYLMRRPVHKQSDQIGVAAAQLADSQ